MKKVALLVFVILILSLFSCSKNKETDAAAPEQTTTQDSASKVDYDLSGMNYNMLSSITFEMLVEPEKYIGKTIKMSGQFYSEIYEGNRYYSVIVWDATRCCPSGMDFIPPGGMQFPDDFPQEETQITVTGTLRENAEDGNLFFYADKVDF